eukprot:Nitzschia sp. Nitz4//scaffold123_size70294//3909//5630//NITZ4_005917-RA/size70294-processed-gene-0.13-mRNA-1//-1//CDS//3329534452//6094//frame0
MQTWRHNTSRHEQDQLQQQDDEGTSQEGRILTAQQAHNDSSTTDNMMEKPHTQPTDPSKKKRKRKPPAVPWKKPKDMPRRPLSAYNIFFKQQREAMMAAASNGNEGSASSGRSSNKSVGIGFANLARTIAANWKELPDSTRAPFEEMAAKEKERYNKEMLVWRAKQKEEKERAKTANNTPTPDDDRSFQAFQGIDAAAMRARSGMHHGNPGQVQSLESPKKSRFSYQGAMPPALASNDFTPLQLNNNMPSSGGWQEGSNSGYSTPRDQFQRLHSSLSGLDALQAGVSIPSQQHQHQHPSFGYNQEAGHPYQMNHHSNEPYQQPFMQDSWMAQQAQESGQPTSGEDPQLLQRQQQLYYQQQRILQQQGVIPSNSYQPFERRNTWSGSDHNTEPQAYRSNNAMSSGRMGSSAYPDNWFSLDTNNQTAAPSAGSQRNQYPSSWFQVDEQQNSTAGQYNHSNDSSGGDLTGKLPSTRKSDSSDGFTPLKLGDNGKGKIEKMKGRRSLEQVASNSSFFRNGEPDPRVQRRQSHDASSSRPSQSLGVQFDDDTMDFLTRLQREGGSSSSSGEGIHSTLP